MTATGYRLAIDFGTTTTVAMLVGPDGRVIPLLFDASPLLSSAVCAGDTVLTGADALRAAVSAPAGFEPNPKRRIDEGVVWLGEREVPVAELIAAVLGRVAAEARRVVGGPPAQVVLTHPASWGGGRCGVLVDAARRAGLGEVGLVAEPVAAAAYFAAVLGRQVHSGQCLVVYDLGAGTFDAAVVRLSPAGFEVVAADGLADVGGLDLDAVVVSHAHAATGDAGWPRLDEPRTAADRHARQALWQGARAVKEQLSRHPAASLHVPLVDAEVRLTRDEFERAVGPYLARTVALTSAMLTRAGVRGEWVAGVLLVGGGSRIPLAGTLLHRAIGIAPTAIDHPELVVAEGALRVGSRTGAPPPAYPKGSGTAVRPAAHDGGRPARRLAVAGAAVAAVAAVAVAAVILWPEGTTGEPDATGSSPATTRSAAVRPTTEPTVGAGSGALTELRVTTLVEGDGERTRAGQTLTVHYVGVFYTTGEQFDASWDSEPFTFALGTGVVIRGWDQGLAGVRVGSRVQLDIPAALAYGDNPTQGQPGGPLRFVVDVLSAQ
ncbi:Hsp70 family protein [Phytohabitans rumicis]|uniref:peptidylprolyl isomerase n=1 Tax=Phytohabitans rumicis TaxID=1076125 RepID=A0A6V8KSQ1_9ACTN|nr:Hsp70 family protein [Phytohabitans rumicis]GFJ86834.1 hypothetical protein Prum_004760 [Phytohabitans rumicis]